MGQRQGSLRSGVAGALLVALAGATGCGSEPAPSWIALRTTAVHEPAERCEFRGRWGQGEATLVHETGLSQVSIPLVREDWLRDEERGLWYVPLYLSLPTDKRSLQLVTPDGPVRRHPMSALVGRGARGFQYSEDRLVLGPGSEVPPETATVLCKVPRPSTDDERFRHPTFAGRGIDVLPGLDASCTLDLPANGVLRFATAFEQLVPGLWNPTGITFRILLDGEVLFEHHAEPAPAGFDWQAVPLPPGKRYGARLDFQIDGGIVLGAFCDPTIGPARIGTPGQRPWEESRPDILLFLADTFRADNLTACGGTAHITPNLDALADEGLCFLQARSASTWTLPSHASLFSGHYPPQAVAIGGREHLGEGIDTIVERLARAGYRTGAVTDGGFVSSTFGLDQGFGTFNELTENTKDLPALLAEARAFLEADDGRPSFLFVQTYRAHWPYEVSEETRAEHGERLGIRGEATELFEQVVREAHALGAPDIDEVSDMESLPSSPEIRRLATELHAHYLGGVADLDREFGGFLAYLRAHGHLDRGYLVFTSDHGEGFDEHSALFHSSDPFGEQVRVPLLLAGRGLEPRHSDEVVSLVDLAPTLAEMAGIPGDPRWPGRSLLEPEGDEPRTLFGFESHRNPEDAVFVLEGQRKILLTRTDDDEHLEAYDLARDAAETHDMVAAGATWPHELLERHAAALRAILQPLAESEFEGEEAGAIDASKAAGLKALGY